MKIKVSDKQLTEWVKEVLTERETITESTSSLSVADKNDVKSLVKKELKEFLNASNSQELEKKIGKMVTDSIKSNKEMENHIVEITRNVLVQLYKNLWTKRNFWANDLRNTPS